jgi:hypothetical protein
MAITTCVVSGTLLGPNGQPLQDATVEAYITAPFFHGDGSQIADLKVTTTTDLNGAWSLTLIETASVNRTMTIAFNMPTGSVERYRREYTIVVPAQASASFATLATGQ